jgi:hypothetical protein
VLFRSIGIPGKAIINGWSLSRLYRTGEKGWGLLKHGPAQLRSKPEVSMKPLRIIFLVILSVSLVRCTTLQTVELGYSPEKALPPSDGPVKVAVMPFEDTTTNGQENPYMVGKLYTTQLLNTQTISYLVTRNVKKEMAAFGFELSTDEIYSMQLNRNDIQILLRKIPYTQVDYLVGGTVSHFFVQQLGRFIAEVEIEAFLIRPPKGDIIWSKKIGYREVRVPFSPDDFTDQSQAILNTLLEKTLRDIFRNSDFRQYAVIQKQQNP